MLLAAALRPQVVEGEQAVIAVWTFQIGQFRSAANKFASNYLISRDYEFKYNLHQVVHKVVQNTKFLNAVKITQSYF